MDEIKAYCKNNKVMKIFLGKKDIASEAEEKLKKDGLIRCKSLETMYRFFRLY
jgi:hypothetical protein